MFDFLKKAYRKNKEISEFERHCSVYNEFYASMYRDFCFPTHEELAETQSDDIDLLETLQNMEYIIGMRIWSSKISKTVSITHEWSYDYNSRHISIPIGDVAIVTQTWIRGEEKDQFILESTSVLHEEYIGHAKYICNYINSKAGQKRHEDKLREEGKVKRAIALENCKETQDD